MLNLSWQTHILNLTHIKSPPGVRTSESNAFLWRKTVLTAHLGTPLRNTMEAHVDEGMTNGPPIFAYLVFGPGRVSLERLLRPMRVAFQHGPGAKLGVQVRTRRT
jgi:hypothetical protein